VTVGPYEVLAHIGAGGMGDVWRARDRRIGRDVAIKVMPEAYAPGDERLLRFEQEARAAGALNHPGLVTIFDVGTVQGSPYIVMELLVGETLRDAIGDPVPAPLPLRKVIDYAFQTASALAVAHEKGIIHRDLKPENIFVTSDGRVKILDFGLAKLAANADDADGRNRTGRHLTSSGMVVGTPGYMSPEQVRAHPLDHRTDIFALGAVLYEMISGIRAFDRDSAIETMNAVLKEEPQPLPELDPDTPAALDAIVRHCLEKNPRERFQSARDLAFQLHLLLPEFQKSRTDNLRAIPEDPPKSRLPRRSIIAAASLLALAAGGFTIYRTHGAAAAPPTPRTYQQLTFGEGVALLPTLSPDGKVCAYVSSQRGNRDIFVQRLDGRTATDITSDSPADDSEPAFSPDGSKIAFRSEREGGGIFVMGVTGESVVRLTDAGHNPSWSNDGTRIVFSTAATDYRPHMHGASGDLWIVDVRTQAKTPLFLHSPKTDALQPRWSPNGKRIAFWGVAARSTAQRDIWTIDPNDPQPQRTLVPVTNDRAVKWNPVWSPDGRYLYFGSDADGTLNLWRVAIDEASGKPQGGAEPLYLPAATSGDFAFSPQGELAFTAVTSSFRLLAAPFDPQSGTAGAPRPLFGGSMTIDSFEPRPDKQSIAFTTAGGQEDVFIVSADGAHLRPLTNDAAKDRGVTWSPDGETLYFDSNRDGNDRLWTIRADGSGLSRVTDDADLRRLGESAIFSPAASPDGKTLAACTGRYGVLVHLDRPLKDRIERAGDGLSTPKWSPDGKAILWSTHNGNAVVYSLAAHTVKKVLDRAPSPQWLPDSRHIAFFEKESIGIVDLDRGSIATTPFQQWPGAESVQLSRDGSTLYQLQTQERGDIWIAHFSK
jgi:serine/threonine protein kinase/sugar lactone lactonase YvrE